MKARLVQLERSGPAGRTRIEGMKVSVVISARGNLLLEMQRCNRKVNLRQMRLGTPWSNQRMWRAVAARSARTRLGIRKKKQIRIKH